MADKWTWSMVKSGGAYLLEDGKPTLYCSRAGLPAVGLREKVTEKWNASDDLLSAAKELLEAVRADGCSGYVFDEMRRMTARQATALRAAISRAEA